MTREADDLIAQALRGDAVEEIKLLDEFFHGYPVEQLRRLFESEQDNAVRMGAWVASELGEKAGPLVDDLIQLTHHRSRSARFWAVDALLGLPQSAASTVAAVSAIDDQDDAVRWKAMQFLARARPDKLRAGLDALREQELGRLLSWLVDVDASLDAGMIIQRLQDANQRVRLFAAAAAARVAKRDATPLHKAADSTDAEVSSFAREWMKALAGK